MYHLSYMTNNKGYVLGYILMALAWLSVLGVAAYGVFQTTAGNTRLNAKTITDSLVTQALYALVTESDYSGSLPVPPAPTDNPYSSESLPADTKAPKKDYWAKDLKYCKNNSPSGLDSIFMAVISSGEDKTFQTTCVNALAGTVNGDDVIKFINGNQMKQGVGGTVYYGDPVEDKATLDALNTDNLKDGELRLVKAEDKVYRYKAGTGWVAISGGGGESSSCPPGINFTQSGCNIPLPPGGCSIVEADRKWSITHNGSGKVYLVTKDSKILAKGYQPVEYSCVGYALGVNSTNTHVINIMTSKYSSGNDITDAYQSPISSLLHSCFVSQNGEVFCAGNNAGCYSDNRRLSIGNGNTSTTGYTTFQQVIRKDNNQPLTNVIKAIGFINRQSSYWSYASCAVTSQSDGGKLWCWGGGYGNWNALNESYESAFAEYTNVNNVKDFVSMSNKDYVSSGNQYHFTCALKYDNTLVCRGNNDYSRLNAADNLNLNYIRTIYPDEPSSSQIVKLELTLYGGCVLMSSGNVYCAMNGVTTPRRLTGEYDVTTNPYGRGLPLAVDMAVTGYWKASSGSFDAFSLAILDSEGYLYGTGCLTGQWSGNTGGIEQCVYNANKNLFGTGSLVNGQHYTTTSYIKNETLKFVSIKFGSPEFFCGLGVDGELKCSGNILNIFLDRMERDTSTAYNIFKNLGMNYCKS